MALQPGTDLGAVIRWRVLNAAGCPGLPTIRRLLGILVTVLVRGLSRFFDFGRLRFRLWLNFGFRFRLGLWFRFRFRFRLPPLVPVF